MKYFVPFLSLIFCLSLLAENASEFSTISFAPNSNSQACLNKSCHTIFSPPSAGEDLVQDRIIPFYSLTQKNCFSGAFAVSLKYDQSFNGKYIAQDLLGSNVLNFVGSQTPALEFPQGLTILADNLGLSPLTLTTLQLNPTIKRFVTRIQLHLGFDEWIKGLWLKIIVPIEYTQWTLEGCSPLLTTTHILNQTPFPAGLMIQTNQTVTPASTLKTALDGRFGFGDMTTPWIAGRFNFDTQDKSGVADLHFYIGYDLLHKPHAHVSSYLVIVAPTDDKPNVSEIFHPLIGTGDHWQLGAGLNIDAQFYTFKNFQTLTLSLQGHVAHLFKSYQPRLFDFKNHGCLSRYQLMKEFTQMHDTVSYKNLINGVNFATRFADVETNHGEAVLELQYRNQKGLLIGVGYDIYGRQAEKLSHISRSKLRVGFKGCACVNALCYPTTLVNNVDVISTGLPTIQILRATQSNSTIAQCGTTDSPQELFTPSLSPMAGLVCVDCTNQVPLVPGVTPVASLTKAFDSKEPQLVHTNDLNICSGGMGKLICHKVFMQATYTWHKNEWLPFIGGGAEVQGSTSQSNTRFFQGGIWLNAGFQF